MASPKALILQGILGVGGLCASGAGGIGLGLGRTFGGVQSDQAATDSADEPEINPQNIEVVKEEDLGIPKECDTTCSLTAEQLRNLKFEQKGEDGIAFEGLEDSDEFELLIEVTEDETNYPKGKKYTLRPKTIAGPVTIKNIKEGDIVLEGGKEVLIRETISGKKLEHLLEEVNGLGIPKRCVADQVEGATAATKTCDLTKHQLQKLKFEARSGEKITVEGLNEGNIVTLKIEDKGEDGDNYPHGKKYTLTSTGGYVTILGVKGGNIVLGDDEEVVVREKKEGGKLERLLDEIDRLGIPKRCNADGVSGETPQKCYLIQKQLKDLKFEAKEGTSVAVEGWSDNSKFELTIENKPNDEENYPKGKKYKLEAITGKVTIRGLKEGDIDIWENQSVAIRETREGDKLEMAPVEVDELGVPRNCKKTCNLTAKQLKKLQFETKENSQITIEGLDAGKMVTLRVEEREGDIENYPKGRKYTLQAKETVTIGGLSEGDIEIGRKKDVIIREKIGGGKFEKAPEEIDNLGIPRACGAEEVKVNADSKTCQLTKEQLQKIKFEDGGVGSSISIEGLEGGDDKVELTIVGVIGDEENYPKQKKYTFKAKAGQVTIRGAKDGSVVLEQDKDVVFREIKRGNKLETYLDVLGIPKRCKAEEVKGSSDSRTCELSQEELKKLKFENFEEKTGEVKVDGLTEREKIKLTISWDEDTNTYPDNRKYSFDNTAKKDKDIKISKGGEGDLAEVTIAKQKATWFKNVDGKLAIAEIKEKSQIAKENKLEEVNKILKKLGFKELSTSIYFTGDDADNPTKHTQTKVAEFSKAKGNESDLKKIKFQALGGGAETVDNLYGSEIKVYLDWEPDANRFPNNMKFSIENQGFSTGFYFWKGGKSITIEQKKSGTKMPEFKVENYQLVKVS